MKIAKKIFVYLNLLQPHNNINILKIYRSVSSSFLVHLPLKFLRRLALKNLGPYSVTKNIKFRFSVCGSRLLKGILLRILSRDGF